uniref:Uncharacterized protein n=1 Tax=Anopheles culicifacies TaxID=139723 RepID=A0A182MRI2_9DIPT
MLYFLSSISLTKNKNKNVRRIRNNDLNLQLAHFLLHSTPSGFGLYSRVFRSQAKLPESIGATGVDRSTLEWNGILQRRLEYSGVDGAPKSDPEFYRSQSRFSKHGVEVDS